MYATENGGQLGTLKETVELPNNSGKHQYLRPACHEILR